MFIMQRAWVKKHKKHLTLIFAVFLLWTTLLCFVFYKIEQRIEQKWISSYIEAEHRAEMCRPLNPKIIKQKTFI